MVDWYYILPILLLGVYPSPKDIYNVVKFAKRVRFTSVSGLHRII